MTELPRTLGTDSEPFTGNDTHKAMPPEGSYAPGLIQLTEPIVATVRGVPRPDMTEADEIVATVIVLHEAGVDPVSLAKMVAWRLNVIRDHAREAARGEGVAIPINRGSTRAPL